jgi:flavin-dependent dehydrogenase
MSRPFFESHVRRRVLGLPNVRLRTESHVDGFLWSDASVAGVLTGGGTVPADLVVDATGRGSKTPQWLEAAGYTPAVEEKVEVGLSYTTRQFHRKPGDMGGDFVAVITPTLDGKRAGVMLGIEGDRWTATMIGYHGQTSPEDLEGFIAYAKSLAAPYIYDVISRAEPIGEPRSARMPHSLRRRYELLGRFPDGLLVTGDAMCSFNPIYGQGMTVAALEGRALREALAEEGGDLAERFFQRAAEAIESPWTIAVGNDLRMPETVGPRNAGVTLVNWYLARLQRLAHRDRDLALAFHRVANLLDPPPTLMQPGRIWRVLTGLGVNAQPQEDKAVPAAHA